MDGADRQIGRQYLLHPDVGAGVRVRRQGDERWGADKREDPESAPPRPRPGREIIKGRHFACRPKHSRGNSEFDRAGWRLPSGKYPLRDVCGCRDSSCRGHGYSSPFRFKPRRQFPGERGRVPYKYQTPHLSERAASTSRVTSVRISGVKLKAVMMHARRPTSESTAALDLLGISRRHSRDRRSVVPATACAKALKLSAPVPVPVCSSVHSLDDACSKSIPHERNKRNKIARKLCA
jgi:hypothetical protein